MEDLLDLLQHPESLAFELVDRNQSGNESSVQSRQQKLQRICQALFRQVESLAGLYGKVVLKEENGSAQSLSTIDQLYFSNNTTIGDAEIVYGQVQDQNLALKRLLKKSKKRLVKAVESGKVVRLLEDAESVKGDENDDESQRESGDEGDVDDDEGEESEEKRIRERMERVMDEMSDEEEQVGSKHENSRSTEQTGDSNIVDPIAEGLKDGFFDLIEMEAFADEEEEYLPEDAFDRGEPKARAIKDERSLHQKMRDGDADGNIDGDLQDDSEDEFLESAVASTIRRKRYREDDEIEALYQLYEKPQPTLEEEEDNGNDPANMTAADIFGKPIKKYYNKWYGQGKDKIKASNAAMDKMATVATEDSSGINRSLDKMDHDNDEEDGKIQDDKNERTEEDDEEVPMKGQGIASKTGNFSSAQERKDQKLQKQIEQLERDMISEKPWQMKGEIQAKSRPLDSLLQSTPEFEVAAKQAPVITVEHTASLEDIIKKRIVDEDWDDVIPRELPDVAWAKKKGELPEVSQEKSKLGLGELYEREYLKKAVGYDVDSAEKQSEEEKAKNEMKTLFANLCSKLDALSNYHFAPRPVADEAEIRPTTKPAIAMEEVLPLHVSDARVVAPEEVYASKRGRDGILRSDSELQQQDRKRLRSAKKTARRKARKAKLADEKLISRLEPGLGLNNPYEKRKIRNELSAARARGKITTGTEDSNSHYGKSTTFFKRMQLEAQEAIRSKKISTDDKESEKDRSKSSALKL